MSRQFGRPVLALVLGMSLALMAGAESRQRPDQHPCTGADIPLSGQRPVVLAAECMFQGRVIKVEKIETDGGSGQWWYRLRILLNNEGRVKTVDLNPETGLPTDPKVLEKVYEALDRRG